VHHPTEATVWFQVVESHALRARIDVDGTCQNDFVKGQVLKWRNRLLRESTPDRDTKSTSLLNKVDEFVEQSRRVCMTKSTSLYLKTGSIDDEVAKKGVPQ